MIRLTLLSLLTAACLCFSGLAAELPGPEMADPPTLEAETPLPTAPAVPEPPAQPEIPTEPEKAVLITCLMESASPQKQEILFLAPGQDPAALALPAALSCVTDGEAEYGGPLIYDCPVIWDTAALNTAEAGKTAVIGRLSPEKGYALGPDTDGQVTHPMVITAPGMPKEALESVELDGASFSLTAMGGETMEPDLTCTGAVCYAGGGTYFPCSVDWDLTPVDHAVPGVYPITGTPRLPEGFSLPEGSAGLTAEVGVVSPDYVDLSAPCINPQDNAYVFFSWLHQPQDRRSMVLQYSTDGSSWQDTPVDEYGVDQYGTILWNGLGLTLNLTKLEPGRPYHFRILYDGDQVSNTAELCVTDTEFTVTVGGKGGDRDGGDQPAEPLPDYQQPAPETEAPSLPVLPSTPPVTPSRPETPPAVPVLPPSPWVPEPAPHENFPPEEWSPPEEEESADRLLEINTQDATSISQTRLQQLAGASDTVLFEKHGVAVELSSAFLSALKLFADELLTVEIRLPEPSAFTLDLRVGNDSLETLPDTLVRLPWDGPEAALYCCHPDGTVLSKAHYHPQSETVSCTVSAPGTYRIIAAPQEETPVPPEPENPTAPRGLIPVLAALSLGGAAVLLWRKLRHEG